jgi:hypothetical protein
MGTMSPPARGPGGSFSGPRTSVPSRISELGLLEMEALQRSELGAARGAAGQMPLDSAAAPRQASHSARLGSRAAPARKGGRGLPLCPTGETAWWPASSASPRPHIQRTDQGVSGSPPICWRANLAERPGDRGRAAACRSHDSLVAETPDHTQTCPGCGFCEPVRSAHPSSSQGLIPGRGSASLSNKYSSGIPKGLFAALADAVVAFRCPCTA